ncbi:gluconeogenesis factor YvcK family protein [Deinococcus actinosclerus]|uniref:Putative gluconeogenesis factor n=1 Tax=Deinococcus actinosclerus TaxID=1768108 RepID=A0ABM5X3V9_9DEIO|nr:hypothetical protein AUC44_05020 [Deinococcus actinosclerus]
MSDPPLPPHPHPDAAPDGRGTALRARGRRATRRARMWMSPGIGVKRWLALFVACTLLGAIGVLHFTWTGPLHFTATRWILWVNALIRPEVMPLYVGGIVLMLLALFGALWSIMMLNRSVLSGTGTAPDQAVDLMYQNRHLARGPRIVTLGGGTGMSNLLSGLRVHTGNTTAIVTVADDGGSSGRLRQSLDMIAPGDLTDCYAALSDSPVMARLLLHRFQRGDGIAGHTFGNLMLATLSEEEGSLSDAMIDIHEVLRIRGRVYPAATQPPTLVAHLSDGRTIRGESQFARQVGAARIGHVTLDPPDLPALPEVLQAIRDADQIVLGPGSLYTSIIPALLVPAVAHELRQTPAPLIYVASLMTEPGETDDLTLEGHVQAITRHLGRAPDCVLVNNAMPPRDVIERYAAEGAHLLGLGGASRDLRGRSVILPLLHPGQARHDPAALAQALLYAAPRRDQTV